MEHQNKNGMTETVSARVSERKRLAALRHCGNPGSIIASEWQWVW